MSLPLCSSCTNTHGLIIVNDIFTARSPGCCENKSLLSLFTGLAPRTHRTSWYATSKGEVSQICYNPVYWKGKEKGKKSIYIAPFTVIHSKALRCVSPPQQLRQQTSNCSSLLIYRPRKDERLSWPSWLTCSGWLTHISGHPSATGRAQDSESTSARDRCSTAGPRHHSRLVASAAMPVNPGLDSLHTETHSHR